MQSLAEHLEALRAEERELQIRLASVQAAIAVVAKGQPHIEPLRVEPPEPPYTGPNLDGLRIKDAMNMYLAWERDSNGRPKVTLGELEKVLLAHEVVSFRGQPFRAMRHTWKTLTNILGSPENAGIWIIERHAEDHFQKADTITLKAARRKPVQG